MFPISSLHNQYVTANPFPHVIIDGMFDEAGLVSALAEWPVDGEWKQHQKQKRSSIQANGHKLQALIDIGRTRWFTTLVEEITGIDDLIQGRGLAGGGLTEVFEGGTLGIHVDFNRDDELYRRVNCILYLNPEWKEEWGGVLGLCEGPNAEQLVRVVPVLNRLIIFEASERSWHGHTEPIRCPTGISRRAVSWYYFTKEIPETAAKKHSTIYADRL